jgi:hypothetical protein
MFRNIPTSEESKIAVAQSEASALVGVGLSIILSNICKNIHMVRVSVSVRHL